MIKPFEFAPFQQDHVSKNEADEGYTLTLTKELALIANKRHRV